MHEIDAIFEHVRGALESMEIGGTYPPLNYLRSLSKKYMTVLAGIDIRLCDDILGARSMLEARGDEGALKLLQRVIKPLAILVKSTTEAHPDSEFMTKVNHYINR